MLTEDQADRLSRFSRRFLFLSIGSLIGIAVGWVILHFLYRAADSRSLSQLGYAIWIYLIGVSLAGVFGLGSLITGVAVARKRRHVLFWTIPLWLLGGFGLVVGVLWLCLLVNDQIDFLSRGKADDFAGVAGIYLAANVLFALAYWLICHVYRKPVRFFPWWSVPLWSIVLVAALSLLPFF